VFTATATEHNPFWPIGWVKTETDTTDTSAPTVPHTEDFTVTTILLNDPPMAVINGKDMAEGEVAALPVNGANVVVQLMAVQDGRVILRWQNQNIVVPIHRDEELSQAGP
jgi:L-ascorbate metabolism protein UlaG (beta-lactamase superfamily)